MKILFLKCTLAFGLTMWLTIGLLAEEPKSNTGSSPTPTSSPTTPTEKKPPETTPADDKNAGARKYVVVFPQVPIRKKIPLDVVNENYIDDKEGIGGILVRHDIVKSSDQCGKKNDSSKDWLCVSFVEYGDHSEREPRSPKEPELKIGWVYGLSLKEQEPKDKWIFMTQEFPPFTYLEKGEVISTMDQCGNKIEDMSATDPKPTIVEIIKNACKKAEIVECKIEPFKDWNEAQKKVKNGEAQGLFVIGEKSRKYLLFSPKLTKTEYVFFKKSDDDWKYEDDKESLKDKTVEAYANSSTCDVLYKLMKKAGIDDVKSCSSNNDDDEKMPETSEEVFERLRKGDIRIAFSSKDVGLNILKKSDNIVPIKYDGKDVKYYVGIGETVDSQTFFKKFQEELNLTPCP